MRIGWTARRRLYCRPLILVLTLLSSATAEAATDKWIHAARFALHSSQPETALYPFGRAQSATLSHQQAQQLQDLSANLCQLSPEIIAESAQEKAALDPLEHAMSLSGAGQMQALQQALEAAEKHQLDELYAYAAGWLGRLYLRQNQPEQAKAVLARVSSNTTFTLPGGIALAEAHYQTGQPQKALAVWVSLNKRYPNEVDSIAAALYAATTFAQLGDEGQALHYFQLARRNSQQALEQIAALHQQNHWLEQLERQPEQLGDARSRTQLYDFYARHTGHRLLQNLQQHAALQHCLAQENQRLTTLKPALQQKLREWQDELTQQQRLHAELGQKIKTQKQKIATMQEVFQTLRTEEVLPQAKVESFGEQVERVKSAEKKRDPVNNYVSIEEHKDFDLTRYQLSLQSRERQSIKSAQAELIELSSRWLEAGERSVALEQKIKRIPAQLVAMEQKLAGLADRSEENYQATRNRLQQAAHQYLGLKQERLKRIQLEAQMGELSLVDKAVKSR